MFFHSVGQLACSMRSDLHLHNICIPENARSNEIEQVSYVVHSSSTLLVLEFSHPVFSVLLMLSVAASMEGRK